MSDWKLRRFWEKAEIGEVEGGFAVTLDGRSVKTPAKRPLTVPTRGLAQEIAAEWAAQEGHVNPMTMPFTRTANAAIDKVAIQHREVADMLAEYGDSDLLCYRAEGPDDLVARQAAHWNPLLDWAGERFAARLEPRTGLMHAGQSPEALSRLRDQLYAMDNFQLAAMHDLVSLSGSLVIGLAAAHGVQNPESLWDVSRLDESWQEEKWGQDEEATELANVKRAAFLHANRVYVLCVDAT